MESDIGCLMLDAGCEKDLFFNSLQASARITVLFLKWARPARDHPCRTGKRIG